MNFLPLFIFYGMMNIYRLKNYHHSYGSKTIKIKGGLFMFGKRSDGIELKHIDPLFKLIPNIMMERSDAHVYFNQDVALSGIQEYISRKAEEGITVTLLDIVFAGIVRILAERPKLNRFAINGRVYARKGISISIAIKKSLSDDGEETTLKVHFDGTENLFEVKDKLQKIISENKDVEANNDTDKTVKILGKIPTGVMKFAVKLFKFLDKHGMLPKSLIEVSPFHTTCFVTNVGSLGIDSIYHHLYNFGTTSMFFAMGKKKKSYIYDDDEIHEDKSINIAFVGDERICDGYYYAHSFRQLNKYWKKPELLEEKPESVVVDPEI